MPLDASASLKTAVTSSGVKSCAPHAVDTRGCTSTRSSSKASGRAGVHDAATHTHCPENSLISSCNCITRHEQLIFSELDRDYISQIAANIV